MNTKPVTLCLGARLMIKRKPMIRESLDSTQTDYNAAFDLLP